MTTDKPRVVFAMPAPRRSDVFSAATLDRLDALADVEVAGDDTATIARRLTEILLGADACLTGWGAPPIQAEFLGRSPKLKIIAHSAGTIRHIVPVEAFERGIVVCHAARVIAESVCEATLLAILTGLRRFHEFDQALKAGQPWAQAVRVYQGHQLAGKTVGLVGCGYVARQVVSLLKPFGARILVYDPYLPADQAAELGVVKASLEDVMQADVVSNHAPITPETRHLIGARELALIRDGAVFVNTARAWAIDQDAMLKELLTGRFWAALDVFEPEPLPNDSPLRKLDNVLLTPHRAGHTVETVRKQGAAMVDELERFFAGEPLQYQVARESYAIMA